MRVPIEKILRGERPAPAALEIGRSRQGRPVAAHRLGSGPLRLSLIAGCHADEPVGPAMLRRLAAYLAALPPGDPLLAAASWSIVPHVNPDGERRNAAWSETTRPAVDSAGAPDRVFDPGLYVRHVVREPPGDDVEFGFPRGPDDAAARPENRAVAAFLAGAAPLGLHASFHGMAFAPGPWFLLEAAWADRTADLRRRLRRRVRALGYRLFDPDRRGEKGFRRIGEGFSTRPDSVAMAAFFTARGDAETAARFRPSSMELARSLGGDPLTLVSEMPLFVLPPGGGVPVPDGSRGIERFRRWLAERTAGGDAAAAARSLARDGVRGMPVRDQMRLQLAYLDEAIRAVAGGESYPPPAGAA